MCFVFCLKKSGVRSAEISLHEGINSEDSDHQSQNRLKRFGLWMSIYPNNIQLEYRL